MNWDQVEGKWKQVKGQAKEKWGKLTDDDLDVIDGRRQQLVGRIQERYGIAKEAAEEQADEFVKALKAEDRGRKKSAASWTPLVAIPGRVSGETLCRVQGVSLLHLRSATRRIMSRSGNLARRRKM